MTILILGLPLCIPAEMTPARQAKKGIVPIKPIDLKVRKMNAVKVGSTEGNDRVAVTVQVMAGANIPPGHEVCSGPFKVKVNKDMGGVGGGSEKTATPVGVRPASSYTAIVDNDHRIAEANESNNRCTHATSGRCI